MHQDHKSLFRLHLSPGLGRLALFKLRTSFESFTSAVNAPSKDLIRRAGLSPRQASNILAADDPRLDKGLTALQTCNARLVSYWDVEYPPLLKQIHDPPALLYVRGQLPTGSCFAIVGSRKATPGGLRLTEEIAAELATRKVTVVSGLARGIDTAAHRGALSVGGPTVAVLGCGIDRAYPQENVDLFQQILQKNAIISEYPPGAEPLAGHFPGRNRIISGLSTGVLVVEAADGSGSLITGDFALEQSRELFAVPGAVKSATSFGTNRLIKQGAQVVTEAGDILHALWPQSQGGSATPQDDPLLEELEGAALTLYQSLDFEPKQADDLGRACGLTPMELSAILLDLELRGGIQTLPGGRYIRAK